MKAQSDRWSFSKIYCSSWADVLGYRGLGGRGSEEQGEPGRALLLAV
jgi:hypothetical protein